jgi:CRP/FNR family transcriptional regulator, cyclic AMP receptor protein
MAWPAELDVLCDRGWLATVGQPFREAVLSGCTIKRLVRGDVLYHAGDPPGGLFGLAEGGLGVIVAPTDREPYLGLLTRPGFWTGEGSVITRQPRFIGLRAVRDSLVAHLPLARWDALARAEPEAWRWLAHLSLRNAILAVNVADVLLIRRSSDRVAAMLLLLAATEPAVGHEAAIKLQATQDDLAKMTNLSRSSVGRILDGFERDGLIAHDYRTIQIADIERLKQRRARGR